MAYETKVLLKMLARQTASAESLEEVYEFIADAANAEGVHVPGYLEALEKVNELKSRNRKKDKK